MSARNEILANLRSVQVTPSQAMRISGSQLFSDYPPSLLDLRKDFEKNLQLLKGEYCYAPQVHQASATLAELVKGGLKIIAHESTILSKVIAADTDGALQNQIRILRTNEQIDSKDMANYGAGLTSADCLIARTGSVGLRTETAGGRRLSVLPPFHIVLAGSSQLRASLENYFSELPKEAAWSYATIISGPSRTADIEKILILGAHGPKRLLVILIEGL